MCGIAGIWGEASRERLERMGDAIAHRGPDDTGIWIDPQAQLGLINRRLSIIDIEGGKQPIFNTDGSVVVVFNGEIYNYIELREQLQKKGYVFRTQSDTEVIAHLYDDCGTRLAEQLRGMFAIAIWDTRHRQLVLIRDRAGQKPLYYSETQEEFRFCSEIKGLKAVSRESLTIDDASLSEYLAWTMVRSPRTIYKEIQSLEPATVAVVKEGRIVSREPYWSLQMEPKENLTKAEAIERVDQNLREAVRLRLRSDVPVGTFLSGGIDSGIVTALASEMVPGSLKTICVGFEDGGFDERPLARMVAQRYGTDHEEIILKQDVKQVLPTIAAAWDQPYADSSAIPSWYVSQAGRKHTKVVLNGDGGDEVFAGYRRYVAARLSGILGKNFLKSFWKFKSAMMPKPVGFRSTYAFAHRLIRGLARNPQQRYFDWAVDGISPQTQRQLSGNADWVHDGFGLPKTDAIDPVDAMLATDFRAILPDDLLVKMDIATMAHSLEARSPFLDHVLVDTVAKFPAKYKIHGLGTKPLLRELSKRYLPPEVCKAPKRGFEIPRLRWLHEDLKNMRNDVILSSTGILADRFDRTRLQQLLEGESSVEPGQWARQVWILLMLGLWDQTVR